jgi:SNF2 family DNA or RNA helicase
VWYPVTITMSQVAYSGGSKDDDSSALTDNDSDSESSDYIEDEELLEDLEDLDIEEPNIDQPIMDPTSAVGARKPLEPNRVQPLEPTSAVGARKPLEREPAPFDMAYAHLDDFKIKIFDECIAKGSGGMSLPMGTGKTLISILVGLKQTEGGPPILYIASKTLISSAISEVRKWFGNSLPYQVMQSSKNLGKWTLLPDTRLVLVSDPLISKCFKQYNLQPALEELVNRDRFVTYKRYRVISKPLIKIRVGMGILMSIRWGCLIVDEAQKYTDHNTLACKGIMCIVSKHRWLLSGTLFDEPKAERILGYYCMLNYPIYERSLPAVSDLIYRSRGRNQKYEGLKPSLVFREQNESFKLPTTNKQIVSHTLADNEQKVYLVLKAVINNMASRIKALALQGNYARYYRPTQEQREQLERYKSESAIFRSGLLTMITYLRQSLVCPLLPLATISLKMADVGERDLVSKMLMDEFVKHNLMDYMSDERSIVSTRMAKVMETLDAHPNEKVLVFTSYRTTVDLFIHFIPKNRRVFTLEAKNSMERRGEIIEEFRKTENGVLISTYDIMANGLNLQFATTVLIVDFWWNAGKTTQSIARILRMGQLADTVNVYFFTSNTAIEQALFKKQLDKLKMANDLMDGQTSKGMGSVRVIDLIKFLNAKENVDMIQQVYKVG